MTSKYIRKHDRDPGLLVTATEAARVLGVQPRTVIKWVRADPAMGMMKLGRWYVYRAWLNEVERGPNEGDSSDQPASNSGDPRR